MVAKMELNLGRLQIVLSVNESVKWTRFLKKPTPAEFDLIYLVDVSGSMSSSLEGVKKYCIDISHKLEKELSQFDFHYGGIFYSDPVDVSTEENVYLNLTPNINQFQNFVNNVKLLDGEDGYGAYDIVINKMPWRNGIKCIIHITDEGAHGTAYSSGDGHPEPGPLLERIIP